MLSNHTEIHKAITEFCNQPAVGPKISQRLIAAKHGVNLRTFQYHLQAMKKNKVIKSRGRPSFFSPAQELMLANAVRQADASNDGMNACEILIMAYKKAKELRLPQFVASRGWLRGFFERHQLSLRKPTPIDDLRHECITADMINAFFDR